MNYTTARDTKDAIFEFLNKMAQRMQVRPKRIAWNNQRKARRAKITKENSLYGPWYAKHPDLDKAIIYRWNVDKRVTIMTRMVKIVSFNGTFGFHLSAKGRKRYTELTGKKALLFDYFAGKRREDAALVQVVEELGQDAVNSPGVSIVELPEGTEYILVDSNIVKKKCSNRWVLTEGDTILRAGE